MMEHVSLIVLVVSLALYLLCRGHFIWSNEEFSFDDEDNVDVHRQRYTDNDQYHFHDVYVPVEDTSDQAVIHAWLLIPREFIGSMPVVLLSHGLGAQKDMGLMNYGEHFAGAGYAVLIMDYR